MKRKTTLNISYDRAFLVATLEKAKKKKITEHEIEQKKLKSLAIKQLESELRTVKSGKGMARIYIPNKGTYYVPPEPAETRGIDYLLKQLKLSDSKKIRLGQNDSEFILRFID